MLIADCSEARRSAVCARAHDLVELKKPVDLDPLLALECHRAAAVAS